MIRHVLLASVALALLAPTSALAATIPDAAADPTCVETGFRPPYDRVCVDAGTDLCDSGTRPGEVCLENGQACVSTGARPPYHVVCVGLTAQTSLACVGGDGVDRPRICLENGQACVYKYVGEVPWWYCVDLRAEAAAGDCFPDEGLHLPRACSSEDGTTCVVVGSYVIVYRCVNLIDGAGGCTPLGVGEWQVCHDGDAVCVHGNVGHPPMTQCVTLRFGAAAPGALPQPPAPVVLA